MAVDDRLDSPEHDPGMCCYVEALDKPIAPGALATARAAYLLIGGMGCPACAMRVRNALLMLDGVVAVHVHLQRGLAQVLYDPAQISPERFPAAVATADPEGRHRYTAQLLA